jgi:hypothetical protein
LPHASQVFVSGFSRVFSDILKKCKSFFHFNRKRIKLRGAERKKTARVSDKTRAVFNGF